MWTRRLWVSWQQVSWYVVLPLPSVLPESVAYGSSMAGESMLTPNALALLRCV